MLPQQLQPKTPKRYKLFCPDHMHDHSGDGYNQFWPLHEKTGGSNVLEHLIALGEMYEWYQIVDTRDNNKVIKEKAPSGDWEDF
jgi:hypothetical protein